MTRSSLRTSAGVPAATTRPSAITTTRSECRMTTSMSCSTSRIVRRRSDAQVLDVLEQRASERPVDAGERLVEQEQARLEHQRAGELEQLSLAAGERSGIVVRPSPRGRTPRAARGPCRAPAARLAATRAARPRGRAARRGCAGCRAACCPGRTSPTSAFVSWKVRTIPRRAIACGLCRKIERPSRRTSPRSARSKPVTTLKSVDLPAPFGPISAVIEPSATSNVTSLTAAEPPEPLRDLADAEQRRRPVLSGHGGRAPRSCRTGPEGGRRRAPSGRDRRS